MARQPEVIYEDNHLIAINKPSGILVQADYTGDFTLTDWARDWIRAKYDKPGNVFCGVIHRIDRPVSGLVIMARTSKALSRMNEQFRSRKIQKGYLAIVEGVPEFREGELIHYIKKNDVINKAIISKIHFPQAWECKLTYRIKEYAHGKSCLEVFPITGRPHQIRAQLSFIGHPIIGDVKYGAKKPLADQSICLHAHTLSFIHPIKNEPMHLEAPSHFLIDL